MQLDVSNMWGALEIYVRNSVSSYLTDRIHLSPEKIQF